MSILRTPEQAALQEVLVACKESAHHLDDAAEFAEQQEVSATLRELAKRRRSVVSKLEQALDKTGDLPAGVDPDKETFKDLLHRLHAVLSPEDSQADFIAQRMEAESELNRFIKERNGSDLSKTNRQLLDQVSDEIDEARQQLSSVHARLLNELN